MPTIHHCRKASGALTGKLNVIIRSVCICPRHMSELQAILDAFFTFKWSGPVFDVVEAERWQ